MEDKKGNTTIAISNELWKKLKDLKKHPRDTHNDVLERLIKEAQR